MLLVMTFKISADTTMVVTVDVAKITNGWVVKNRREFHSYRGKDLIEYLTFFSTMDDALAAAAAIFSDEGQKARAAETEARL